MRIAISAQGATPQSPMDPRFGRAPAFLVHDTDTGQWTHLDNTEGAGAAQGAGIQSAQMVADAGATVLLTGRVGPKAEAALAQAGIAVHAVAEGSVAEVLERFLAVGAQPSKPSGGGMGGGGRGMGGGMGGCGRGMGGGGRGMGGGGRCNR